MADITFDTVRELVDQLSEADRARLVEYVQQARAPQITPPPEGMTVRDVMLRVYARARRYWASVDDAERLALTDAELDEQFWLFDADGIPRLKSEQGTIDIPENSLYHAGEVAERIAYRSGRSDVAERSREILNTEVAEHLRRRMQDG
jgi:hypothetical protein